MNNVAAALARFGRYVAGRETVDDVILRIRATTDSLLSGFHTMVKSLRSSAGQLEGAKDSVSEEIRELEDIVLQRQTQVKDLSKEVKRFTNIATNIEKMFELFEEDSEE
jgi:methyl-accepting chemotaxis protein